MPSKSPGKKAYTGVLLKPLPPISEGVTLAMLARGQTSRYPLADPRHGDDLTCRLEALFAHYRLKPDDWEGLALCLAMDHVPGFRVMQAPPGAQPSRRPVENEQLALELRVVMSECNLTGAAAARAIVASGRWSAAVKNPKTLHRRAQAANSDLTRVLEDAVRDRAKLDPDTPLTVRHLDSVFPVRNGRRHFPTRNNLSGRVPARKRA